MVAKFWHFLVKNRSLLFLVLFLLASTGGLVLWQYMHYRSFRMKPIPVKVTNVNTTQVQGANTEGGKSGPQTAAQTTGGFPAMNASFSPVFIRLSEGQAEPQAAVPAQVATGEPLKPEDVQQLLARLPELTPEPGDQAEVRLGQELLPPPRPGETVQQPFPPAPEAVQPAAVEIGPLKVVRYAPEGEIPVAPFVNITFSQPMVPLTTVGDLAAGQSPVKIEPDLPGTWRWLGTKTLNFQYDSTLIDRLPKATVYHMTVPAGTKSATGGVLEQAVEWSFSTPPPRLVSSYPTGDSQPRDPLFFLTFDQRVDPAAVLKTIQVSAANRPASLELVSEAEIKASEKWAKLLDGAVAGRWMAFRAKELFPADSDVTVTIGPGTPSAEGPLTTQAAQSYSFHTYPPLRIQDYGCAWGNSLANGGQCQPLSPLYIRFSNPIDTKTYKETMLRIDPELPGASLNLMGNTLQIQGATQGQTTYSVVVSGEIQDIYGQKLGQEASLKFRIGPAEPVLYSSGQNLITIDPAAKKPVFSVYAINYPRLELSIYAVQPADWPDFKQYLRQYQRSDVTVKVPGRLVVSRTIQVEAAADAISEVNIDLSEVMDGSFGHFIVIVRPPDNLLKDKQNAYWQTVQAWVQVTQIGLDALTDHSDMVAWATDLKDGSPLAGVTITAPPTGTDMLTGEDGVTRFSIPNGATHLVAQKGADQAILPRSDYFWAEDYWMRRPVKDELRWFIFDDRQMYRPGEEVHVKGWARRVSGKPDGDISLVSGMTAVSYRVTDSMGNVIIDNGRAEVNASGGFDFAFTLPQQVNLGYAQITLDPEGDLPGFDFTQAGHGFQIQEFRRPEFEVTARNETPGPYFAGEHAVMAVEAKYYAGGPLPNAAVTWQVSSTPGHYEPPNWPDFTFGTWTPWWNMAYFYEKSDSSQDGSGGQVETFTGQTDANGQHFLRLDFSQGGPKPVSITAQPTVMDVNRQAWTGSTSLLVHPASVYVGLRSDKVFVQRGMPLKIQFIVTDLDGNAIADRSVEVRAARMEWKYRDGNWVEEEADAQTCQQGSRPEPVTCTFDTPVGGTYQITALVSDDKGRQNQSQLARWVSGGPMPPVRNVEQEQVTLIPDQENYKPGDVAQILVQSPFSPAEGLLTINRNGILTTERFSLQDGATTLKIPIREEHIPNLNIQVDLNGSAQRSDDQGNPLPDSPRRPAYASGQLILQIPPVSRTLALSASLDQPEVEPGGETTLNLNVKDANGQPVANAELSVVVVDEAILALSNYQMQDPLQIFYANRPMDLMNVNTRSTIVLANPQAIAQEAGRQSMSNRAVEEKAAGAMYAAPAAAQPTMTAGAAMDRAFSAAAPGSASQPIRVRSDFNPLAVFVPGVITDGDGNARVAVKLPDNLTRYRVMVVAVDAGGRLFGQAETNLTARLPLMVRPSAPRFLNFGDQFELPIVLQNQTDEPMTVDVALRVSNLALTGSQGVRVTVPARDRLEVRFPAAAQQPGTARIQVAVTAGSFADAATIQLPVYTPATTEAFATYGVLDNGAVAQPVAAPSGVFPQYGGLEVSTSSTALQALTDAVIYLVSYPYDCSEQLASRILAIASLRDVLTAFHAQELPSPTEMEASVQADIQTLQGLQNEDGGFPYWRRGQESIPFNTIHTAHALYRAGQKGFTVPAEMQQRTLEYLRQIESHYPAWYGQNTRQRLSAYALYVRSLMGDRDPNKAAQLLDQSSLETMSLDAVGWLWPVLKDTPRAEEIRRLVNNRAVETAGAANFTTDYDDQNYLLLGSNRRTDAILLDGLIGDNPQSDLIPKVVNGLLAHRTQGRWGSTQENVFVLLALDRYFNTFEAQTPDFVARLWLGETYAGSQEFRGRTTERKETSIPMTYLVDPALGGGSTQNLILSKEGAGRLYYRLGLRYAPTDLNLKPLDMGFIVQRMYEAVDDPEDVSQDAEGIWHIKAGTRVRVHLTMVADNRRYHVALVDPLPAGLEIVNPSLAVSGSLPQDPTSTESRRFWWWGPWYQHQNMRDQRAEAFTTLLWDGVYQYTYIARATTPGKFIVPPAKAEEMYSPEVFGRSGSSVVIVK